MTTPDGQQHQETPAVEPGATVRACERCGTVCSADQEWCLSCGVRMTEMNQRLPGLRAAGMVVALAVLLAGGAAAASYAALQNDPRTTAAVPTAPAVTPPAPTPSTTDPAAVTPPPTADTTIPPAVDTTPPASVDPPKAAKTPKTTTTTPPITPPATGSGSSGGGSGSGSGSGGGGSTTTTTTTTEKDPPPPTTGPVTFASGQGSLYDPAEVVADRGEEGNAIDGDTSSAWKVTLNEGATGGFGYVLDFDDATALKSLTIYTPTDGLAVKVLGTTKSTLPPDAEDLGWDALSSETTLSGAKKGKTISLKEVGGRNRKYKHVLVWITTVPAAAAAGAAPAAQINELKATR